jgi:hypothetical protein
MNREETRKAERRRIKFYTRPYKNKRTRERARKYYFPPRKKQKMIQGAPPPPKKAENTFILSRVFAKVRERMKNIKNRRMK